MENGGGGGGVFVGSAAEVVWRSFGGPVYKQSLNRCDNGSGGDDVN